MKSTKRIVGVLLGTLLVFGFGKIGKVWADGVQSPLGSTDSIKLLVTPAVNYGVTITSVNPSGYDFGTVDLNSVTRSTAAILVRNTGNVNENFMLKGGNALNWSLGSSTGTDTAVLQGVFTSSITTIAPVDTEFTDSTDEILTSAQSVVYGNGNRYNLAAAHVIATGGVSPLSGASNGHTRALWLKLKTPSDSTAASQQEFRLYVITAIP